MRGPGDNLLPHCILASLQIVPWHPSAIKLNASISWQDDDNILGSFIHWAGVIGKLNLGVAWQLIVPRSILMLELFREPPHRPTRLDRRFVGIKEQQLDGGRASVLYKLYFVNIRIFVNSWQMWQTTRQASQNWTMDAQHNSVNLSNCRISSCNYSAWRSDGRWQLCDH